MGKRRRAERVSSARSTTGRARASHPMLIAAALVGLNVFSYSAVGGFELVNWDDPTYITENPTVSAGLSWSSAWWALTTGHSPYWHPMTWLSHLLDVSLFGADAGAYHVTSLIVHIASTLLLFELFRRMTGAPGRGAFVAAIFAVHPLHVESVAWIAERKDVLSTFFWMLTVAAYLHYTRLPGWRRYLPVIGAYALALMSKPMVVTLPAVLLLLDVWPLGRLSRGTWTRRLVEKVPLLTLALATTVATVIVQHRVGAMAAFDALPWQTRLANATIGYVAYLWKTVWPTRLAAFYPLFEISAARVAGAAVLLAAITALAIRSRRSRPYLFVGWFWYVVTIAPVIGLLQAGEQGMADRFMYVPMIGLSIAVAWGAHDLVRPRALAQAAAIVIVIACAIVARAQAAHWENSVELWSHAVRVTPDSYIAYENLGQALRERGRLDEAKVRYEEALAHAPARSPRYAAVIHNSIGLVLTRQGRIRDAQDSFAAAVRADPGLAEARSNLGNALAAEGRASEAVEHYEAAAHLKPDYVEPRVGLGGALLRLGRADEASSRFREALKIDPNLAEAHNGLGSALAMQGQDEAAMGEYREALRLKPDLPTAHFNLARLYIKKGDVAQARRHLETALSIDPDYQPARQALAAISAGSR